MINCQSCHYRAPGLIALSLHIQSVHGFSQQEARAESARIAGNVHYGDVDTPELRRLVRNADQRRAQFIAASDGQTNQAALQALMADTDALLSYLLLALDIRRAEL